MELSEFISATLDQIIGGVTDATLKHQASGRYGFINPMDGTKGDAFDSIPISEVRFDVAVTVESASSGSKSGGLNVKVLEARLGSETNDKYIGES